MKILILVVLLTLPSCSTYKCGNTTKFVKESPISLVGNPIKSVFIITEALVCPEELK